MILIIIEFLLAFSCISYVFEDFIRWYKIFFWKRFTFENDAHRA